MLRFSVGGWWSGFLRSPEGEGGGGGGAAPAGDAGAAADGKPAEGGAAPDGDGGSALGGGDAPKGDGKGAADDGTANPTAGSALGGDGDGDGGEGEGKDSSDGADETPEAKIARLEKELAERSAPEAYEPFQLGDGWVMSDEQNAEFTAWAKERNLSQGQAQAALEQYTKQREKDAQQWWEGVKAWREKAKADPEIGGQNRQEALRTMREARDMFGADPELRDLFETAGIGDNPALQRFFYRVGKHLGLGKTPSGQGSTPEKTVGELLYGNK